MSKDTKKQQVVLSKYTISTDDKEDFEYYYNGPRFHGALWDLAQALRLERKHGRYPRFYGMLEKRFYTILEENSACLDWANTN